MRRKTEEKRHGILGAARQVFRDTGFDTSSMADIAEHAQVSKATLYSYFPSKETLFMEVILEAGREHGEAAFGELVASGTLEEGLRALGQRHLNFVLTPEAIALARLAITAGDRSQIGRDFYDRGPGMMLKLLAEHLQGAIDMGQLAPGDARMMAEHLKALYEAGLVERRLFGLDTPPDPVHLQVCVAQAVAIFMGYYAPR